MAASLTIRLLGGFHAAVGGTEIRFPTRKSEALLAYLAYHAGTEQSREKLATLLWGGSGEEQGRQSLRQTLFTVNKLLPAGDILRTSRGKLSLEPRSIHLDLAELRSALDSTEPADLQRASDLYPGPLLDGFSAGEDEFDLWVEREREGLRERVLAARTRLLESLSLSDPDKAIQLALATVGEDPLREDVHRALIALYASGGRRTAAVRQYNLCADLLWRKLSVRPSAETRQLYESVIAETDRQSADSRPRVMPQRPRDTRHILVVEDNLLNQEVIRASLKGSKYELTMVDDGAVALMELGRRQFDLALIDLELPFVGGLTIIEAVRKNGIDLPLIVLTSHQDSEHEVSALTMGADDYLRKPIQKDVLLMRIERVLRSRDHSEGRG